MTDIKNFKSWFESILETLYDKEEAGFAVLMIAFPLLERYLREKSQNESDKLKPNFYNELKSIFSELSNDKDARMFWNNFRHGILHQSVHKKGSLDRNINMISINNNTFTINPINFSKKVVNTILNDFDTYIANTGVSRNHQVAKVVLTKTSVDYQNI